MADKNMFNRSLLAAAVLSLGLVATANAQFKNVTVNGERITVAEFEQVYNNAVKSGAKAGPELEARVRSAVIEERVLLQEAAKAKVAQTKAYRDAMDRTGKQLKLELMLADYARKNPATDKEVRAAYDNARRAYGDTEYQVRHILVKTEAEARQLITQLNNGADFASLAKSHSADPKSGANGGLIGWLATGNVEPAIGEAFRSLKAGSIAQKPVRNQFGWHVVKLDATRKARNFPTFESQKDSLKRQLSELKAKNHYAEIVKNAKVK